MVNVKISYLDEEKENELQVYCNWQSKIFLGINFGKPDDLNSATIALDVNTAIKLSKELRKEIAIAKQQLLKSEGHE